MSDTLKPNPQWFFHEGEIADSIIDGGSLVPQPTSVWHFDQIIADNNPDLTTTTFYIFNNKGGEEGRHRMTDCKLTTRDGNYGNYIVGQMQSPLVQGQWVRAKCPASGVNIFTTIGATVTGGNPTQKDIPIKAKGNDSPPGHNQAGTQEILGLPNDGSFTATVSKECYAQFEAQIKVPADADAGNVRFLMRVYYNIMA